MASEAASIIRREQFINAHIDHDRVFKAAAEGNIEALVGNGGQALEQIAQKTSMDTILHVYIKSRKERLPTISTFMEKILPTISTFMEKILDMCPLLLQQVNAKGDTPLHVGAKLGHPTIVEVLLQHAKAQPEDPERGHWQMLRMTNNANNTALHEAVIHNHPNVVKMLTKKADPDFSYLANKAGETPLYLAAARGSASMVFHILKSCISAAHEGPNGRTALHAAVISNNSNVTEQILNQKIGLTKEIDQYGWTPLHYAAYYGYFSVAKLLLRNDKSAAYIADKGRKMTAVHMAAGQGNFGIIKEIIFHCPECCAQVDSRGWNLLHFAAACDAHEFYLRILLNNPLVRSLINERDEKGNTPCHVRASLNSQRPVFAFLFASRGGYLEALNNQNVSVREILRYGPPDELESELEELDKDEGHGPYPLGVICKTTRGVKQREKLGLPSENVREKLMIVNTLIATVTFTTAFTVPGGYKSEEGPNQGTAVLASNSTFQVFIIMDAIAMILSLSAVFLFSMMSFRLHQYSFLTFSCAIWFTLLAMGAMVVAFITGTYAVLAPSSLVATAICVFCLSFIPVVVFLLFGSFKEFIRGKN